VRGLVAKVVDGTTTRLDLLLLLSLDMLLDFGYLRLKPS